MSTYIGIPRIPTTRRAGVTDGQARILRMACSLLLDYPDEGLADKLAAVRSETRFSRPRSPAGSRRSAPSPTSGASAASRSTTWRRSISGAAARCR